MPQVDAVSRATIHAGTALNSHGAQRSSANTFIRSGKDIILGRHERRINLNLPDGAVLPFASSTMSPELMRNIQGEFSSCLRESATDRW